VEPSRHDDLAQLHQRYYPELVRLAFALTGDWSLAEELGQEAWNAGCAVSPGGARRSRLCARRSSRPRSL